MSAASPLSPLAHRSGPLHPTLLLEGPWSLRLSTPRALPLSSNGDAMVSGKRAGGFLITGLGGLYTCIGRPAKGRRYMRPDVCPRRHASERARSPNDRVISRDAHAAAAYAYLAAAILTSNSGFPYNIDCFRPINSNISSVETIHHVRRGIRSWLVLLQSFILKGLIDKIKCWTTSPGSAWRFAR
jgi:hypothetical protein